MEQPKFNSVEDINAKLEQKILFAKEHAVPSEFLNKNPFSEEDMDTFCDLKDYLDGKLPTKYGKQQNILKTDKFARYNDLAFLPENSVLFEVYT